MDKNARDKIPNVLALLMGMLGMTAMTVYCYGWGPEPFSPRDIATKAAVAWGVMLVMGYLVGMYGKQFVPEPPQKKNAASIALDEPKDGEAVVPVVPTRASIGAATIKAPPSGSSHDGHIDENMLNILLNEAPELPPATPLPSFTPSGASASTIAVKPPERGPG